MPSPKTQMVRPVYTQALGLMVLAALLLGSVACQKQCQPPPTAPYQSLVDTPWRLVSSTDPQVNKNGLTLFDFEILTFARDGSGTINQVTNNTQQDIPIYTLTWQPKPTAGTVTITFTANGGQTGSGGKYNYQYHLGTSLDMTDINAGYTYHYVPFMGVVDPDTTCTFN